MVSYLSFCEHRRELRYKERIPNTVKFLLTTRATNLLKVPCGQVRGRRDNSGTSRPGSTDTRDIKPIKRHSLTRTVDLFSRVHEGQYCLAALLLDARAALPQSMWKVQDKMEVLGVGDGGEMVAFGKSGLNTCGEQDGITPSVPSGEVWRAVTLSSSGDETTSATNTG
jgi:hypothetical protein